MTKPYRTVVDHDGSSYLLEATTEIRKARAEFTWIFHSGAPHKWDHDYCSKDAYPILKQLCKLEAPKGYELVNNGVEDFKMQPGDKCYLGGAWMISHITRLVRSPVCRLQDINAEMLYMLKEIERTHAHELRMRQWEIKALIAKVEGRV